MYRSLILVLLFSTSFVSAESGLSGTWTGRVGNTESGLEVSVELQSTSSGWIGTIDIPGEGVRAATLGELSVGEETIRFGTYGRLPSFFQGAFRGESIQGMFIRDGAGFPLRLNRKRATIPSPRPAAPPADDVPDLNTANPPTPFMLPPGIPGEGFAGAWLGELFGPRRNLRILVKLFDDQGLHGSVDSLDQGVGGLRIVSLLASGRELQFDLVQPSAHFEGQMDSSGSEIVGKWRQEGKASWLILRRLDGHPANP